MLQGANGSFYGTTEAGGASNDGTVYQWTPTGVITLASFSGTNGARPQAGLTLGSDGNVYGTTRGDGFTNQGTVYKITPSGALTTLAVFTGTNGANPEAALTLGGDGNFYGTTYHGGSSIQSDPSGRGYGTIFRVTPTGVLTTLVNFNLTNGAYPTSELMVGPDGNFYGTTPQGGVSGAGTVFRMTPAGTLTTLVTFNLANGAFPEAGLVAATDGYFYGVTNIGGGAGAGTVFRMTASGVLTNVFDFDGANGTRPDSHLIQGSDGSLYGTVPGGGQSRSGAVYRVTEAPQGAAQTASTKQNTAVTLSLSFIDPSGIGIDGLTFPVQPSHGTVSLVAGSITQSGTTGTASVLYTPSAGYAGLDAFAYAVQGASGISIPKTVSMTVIGAAPAPKITGFTPASGPIGTTVTITGTNFTGTTIVGFQNCHAASFTVNAQGTQITTTVPSGAITGPIAVLTPGGQAKSTASFTVTAAPQKPTITGFTPSSGKVGTAVVITGTNLTGTTIVGFQNCHAKTFTVNGAGTQITTTVPSGAATGPLAVLTPGGEAKSTASFTVTP